MDNTSLIYRDILLDFNGCVFNTFEAFQMVDDFDRRINREVILRGLQLGYTIEETLDIISNFIYEDYYMKKSEDGETVVLTGERIPNGGARFRLGDEMKAALRNRLDNFKNMIGEAVFMKHLLELGANARYSTLDEDMRLKADIILNDSIALAVFSNTSYGRLEYERKTAKLKVKPIPIAFESLESITKERVERWLKNVQLNTEIKVDLHLKNKKTKETK